MNLQQFESFCDKNLLGRLYSKNGEKIRWYDNKTIFNISFGEICPIIFMPKGERISVEDIIIFGSVAHPKMIKVQRGFLWWKKECLEQLTPHDIDIAVITQSFESTYIKNASFQETYDMGRWLRSPGIDIVHTTKERLEKSDDSVAQSIKNGKSLFKDEVEWKWDNGKYNCYM